MTPRKKKRTPRRKAPPRKAPRRNERWAAFFQWLALASGLIFFVSAGFLYWRAVHGWGEERTDAPSFRTETLLTTGYCNCAICCSWTTNAAGQAVYAYGRLKGRPKVIGQTCTGRQARRGTVAADPRRFDFGTKLEIPGYGPGVVEDVGGAIKGDHLDLWFPTHEEARRWGRRTLPVRVFTDG